MQKEPLLQFAEGLTGMPWHQLDRIAAYIADQADHCAKSDEEFDPRYVARILFDIGKDIVREKEAETAATATGCDTVAMAT